MIKLSGITFSYPQHRVFSDLEISFQAGKFYGIFGPNGCGKSTLLKIITGELSPQHGVITPVYANALLRAQNLAVCEQEIPARIPLTVQEVVRLGEYPWRRQSDKSDNTLRALELLKLQNLCSQPYNLLSGGERQRVMLARALTQDTAVLLLDEPASSLDVGFRYEFYQILRGLSQRGKCIIMISHDLFIAPAFLDYALLLHQGKILASGTVSEVLTGNILHTVFNCPADLWNRHNSLPNE